MPELSIDFTASVSPLIIHHSKSASQSICSVKV